MPRKYPVVSRGRSSWRGDDRGPYPIGLHWVRYDPVEGRRSDRGEAARAEPLGDGRAHPQRSEPAPHHHGTWSDGRSTTRGRRRGRTGRAAPADSTVGRHVASARRSPQIASRCREDEAAGPVRSRRGRTPSARERGEARTAEIARGVSSRTNHASPVAVSHSTASPLCRACSGESSSRTMRRRMWEGGWRVPKGVRSHGI